MAVADVKWTLFQTKAPGYSLLVLLYLHTATGMSGWGGCMDGLDIVTAVRENSASGEVVAELMGNTTIEGVYWSLSGKDADWFFLDERHIRLNTSADKVLDREVQGPVLLADLYCHEEDILQVVYKVLVEVLNENDNRPVFTENSVQSLIITELTPVNSVVFTVQAIDADNDMIAYSIDQTSPDAEYFRIDLPHSGKVVLSKPLDYETKAVLTVTIHASEQNTAERFNTSTNVTITVLDADDQYPHFLPCELLFQDETSRICTSPVYTVNITEGEEDVVLDFSPGPIRAVDGDRGLNSSLSYAILSGDDDGRFMIDRETGEMTLTRGVTDKLTTPVLHLQVMVYQNNDPRKYSLATVSVHILTVNKFYPEFDEAEYHGFVTAGQNPASLVNTYGSKTLMLHVHDQDFNQGVNPKIYYTFSPTCNYTDIYQLTQEGFLIAKTNQLKPTQKHTLEVMAIDQESGDATFTSVVIEVLSEGQSIPLSPLGDDRLISCTVGKALTLSMIFMAGIGCILCLVMWLKKKYKGKRGPLERGCVAQGKHPNVSLQWFQLESHMDEVLFNNEEYGTSNPSFIFTDKSVIYTHQDHPSCQAPNPPTAPPASDTSFIPTESVCSPVILNNTPTKSSSSSPTCQSVTLDGTPATTENLESSLPTFLDPTEVLPTTSSSPSNHDATSTPSRPDSQNIQKSIGDESSDPTTSPSSQSSIPRSHTQIASAEIDKPFCKPRVKTPPYSPLTSLPLFKQTSTPPLTSESAIETLSLNVSLVIPEQTSMTLSSAVDKPSTSLDRTDQSDVISPSTNSGSNQDGHGVKDENDDGFLADEDTGKKSEGEDELESDEEELLRVIARCNPILISFCK